MRQQKSAYSRVVLFDDDREINESICIESLMIAYESKINIRL